MQRPRLDVIGRVFSCTLMALALLAVGCASSSDDSSASGLDCRNDGRGCTSGFQCAQNLVGDYECLPGASGGASGGQGSGGSGPGPQSGSTGQANMMSDNIFSCCVNGQFYECPNQAALDACSDGSIAQCQQDQSRNGNCRTPDNGGGSSGGAGGGSSGGGSSCNYPGAGSCNSDADCCQDQGRAVCANDGVNSGCLFYCEQHADCSSNCCYAVTDNAGNELGVCVAQDECAEAPEQLETCPAVLNCVTLNCDQVGDTSNDCMLGCGRRAANNEVRDQAWNLVFCAREIGCDLMDLQRGEAGVERFVDCIAPYQFCFDHFGTCVESN